MTKEFFLLSLGIFFLGLSLYMRPRMKRVPVSTKDNVFKWMWGKHQIVIGTYDRLGITRFLDPNNITIVWDKGSVEDPVFIYDLRILLGYCISSSVTLKEFEALANRELRYL